MNKSTFNALFKNKKLSYQLVNSSNLFDINNTVSVETCIDWFYVKDVFIAKNMVLYELSIKNTSFPVFILRRIIKDYFTCFKGLSVVIVKGKMKLVSNVINGKIIMTIHYKGRMIAYSKNAKIL